MTGLVKPPSLPPEPSMGGDIPLILPQTPAALSYARLQGLPLERHIAIPELTRFIETKADPIYA
jgi:hypothetical protein